MAKLTLKPIINLVVSLAARASARKGFNVALIVGDSKVIPESERVRIYTSPDAMIEDGFETTSVEYLAAQLYFSATLAPTKLAVGRKLESDASWVDAARECRAANSEWYVLIPIGAGKEDILTLAGWAETATPDTVLAYTTSDVNNLSDVPGDADTDTEGIFKKLKDLNYRNSFGQYCGHKETQNAVAATMGYAMGANRGTNNSAYTLAYKKLVGVETDDLTETQVQYVCGSSTTTGVNGNVYINRAGYDILQQGRMADGSSFDEVLNLAMLKDTITLNVMDLLTSVRKIPQTDSGVNAIVNVINAACEKFVGIGFIAPGKWTGAPVLELQTGDMLPAGYLVQAESVDDQSKADRENRICPPIYVCIKLAGAIEYVTINVEVVR